MNFVQNFPFFNIIMCLACGVISSVLSAKTARKLSIGLISIVAIMSACVLGFTLETKQSYIYMMGHFTAPWGNEIRIGVLEAAMALFFCIIMLCSIVGGLEHILQDVQQQKQNLYFTKINLMLSSLLALIYTNDLFTAYVFIEINTIAACALIMIRDNGHCLVAAMKYMIMSLIGSGLILISISMLYDLTGHLCIGLAVKSALFPFHSWLPDAYGYATASSSAILSSLVSKGYIFLLIKIFYRVIGIEVIRDHKIDNILFVFAVSGMLIGSICAMREHDIRRLIAYSSVAQIGYIYMGIGLGTQGAMIAALFHIMSHAATKSMLFIAAAGLSEVSGNSKDFTDLKGSGYRNKIAGAAFTVGALSMVGIPLLAGFTSKVYFAVAAVDAEPTKMETAMIILAISTILNAAYFIRSIISIYTPRNTKYNNPSYRPTKTMTAALILFIILNFFLGIGSNLIYRLIESGISMFA